MALIYKITNDINGKIYIGKTLHDDVNKRFHEHKNDYKKRKCEKRPLYDAMNKYGIEHFSIEEIEKCDYTIVNQREQYWIHFYDSYYNGYNATKGGDGSSFLDYEHIYQTYLKVGTIKGTADVCGCCADSVRTILHEKGLDTTDIFEKANQKKRKKVAMLDQDTEEILGIFSSTTEAAHFCGKRWGSTIGRVCREKSKRVVFDHKWEYCDSNLKTFEPKEGRKEYVPSSDEVCPRCGKLKKDARSLLCWTCSIEEQKNKKNDTEIKVNRNELKDLIRTKPFTEIGRQFNVTDNTIKKWCVKLGLPNRKKDINAISDEDWKNI